MNISEAANSDFIHEEFKAGRYTVKAPNKGIKLWTHNDWIVYITLNGVWWNTDDMYTREETLHRNHRERTHELR